MLKVGVTGGIGSGKTTVCRIFAAIGIPVYNADQRAKWLMTNDTELVAAVSELFGTEAYYEDGQLNRQHLSDIIFAEPGKRMQLNALVHPAVRRDGDRWHEQQTGAPYTLKEAALLYETGGNRLLDKMIVVTAPEEVRMKRVMRRDGVGHEAVEARMAAQMPEADKVAQADFVIINDGEHMLIPQVLEVHRQLVKLAGINQI